MENVDSYANLEQCLNREYCKFLVVNSEQTPLANFYERIAALGYSTFVLNNPTPEILEEEIKAINPHLILFNSHKNEMNNHPLIDLASRINAQREETGFFPCPRFLWLDESTEYLSTKKLTQTDELFLRLNHAFIFIKDHIIDQFLPKYVSLRAGPVYEIISNLQANAISVMEAIEDYSDASSSRIQVVKDGLRGIHRYLTLAEKRSPMEDTAVLGELKNKYEMVYQILFDSSLKRFMLMFDRFEKDMERSHAKETFIDRSQLDNISLFDITYHARRQSKHAMIFVKQGDSYRAVDTFFNLDYKKLRFFHSPNIIDWDLNHDDVLDLIAKLRKDPYLSIMEVNYMGDKPIQIDNIAFATVLKYYRDNIELLFPLMKKKQNKFNLRIPTRKG